MDVICEVTLSETLSHVKNIQLFRNVSSVIKPIVTVKSLEPSAGTSIISWQDPHLQSRGTCTGDINAKKPFLKFSIPKHHVHCDDATNYICKMSGIKGEIIPVNEEVSAHKAITCPSRFMKIHSTRPVLTLGNDALEVRCQIFKTTNLYRVLNIDILRNSSKSYQNILSVSSQVNGPSAIIWQDNFLQSRATASGDVSTTSAFLRFRIHAKQVKCADAATYTCRMTAMLNDFSTRFEEVTTDIATRVKPNTLEPLEINPEPDADKKHRVGTNIQFMCAGTFGNPPEGLRWCFRRKGGVYYREYPLKSDITYSDAVSSGYCLYKRTSTLSFVVHQEDDGADFLCEVSSIGGCGSSVAQAKYSLLIHTNTSTANEYNQPNTKEEDDIGKLIAIGILTAVVVVLIVLLLVSIFMLCRCKKQTREKNRDVNHKDREEPEKHPIFDDEKPPALEFRGDYTRVDHDGDYRRVDHDDETKHSAV